MRREQRGEVGPRRAQPDDDERPHAPHTPALPGDTAGQGRDVVVRQILITERRRDRHAAAEHAGRHACGGLLPQAGFELSPAPVAGLRARDEDVAGGIDALSPSSSPAGDHVIDKGAAHRLGAPVDVLGETDRRAQAGEMRGDRGEVAERSAQVVVNGTGDRADEQVHVDPGFLALPGSGQPGCSRHLLLQALEQLPDGQDRVQAPVVAGVERLLLATCGRGIGVHDT